MAPTSQAIRREIFTVLVLSALALGVTNHANLEVEPRRASGWVAGRITLVTPAANSSVTSPHPRFVWEAEGGIPLTHVIQPSTTGLDEADIVTPPDTAIEIALQPTTRWRGDDVCVFSDETTVTVDRVAAIISRYIPQTPLPTGEYCWRVQSGNSGWTPAARFSVVNPRATLTVPLQATWNQIQAVLTKAATMTSVIVKFAPGNRTLSPPTVNPGDNAPTFIAMIGASGVQVDGGGSHVVFTAPVSYVQLINCSDIVISDFTFDIQPYPYTAGRFVMVGNSSTFPVQATMALAPDHPPFESNPHFLSNGIASVMTSPQVSGDGSPMTKRGRPEVMKYGAINRTDTIGGTAGDWAGEEALYTVELLGWSGQFDGLVPGVVPGDFLVVDPRIDPGFMIVHSVDVTLRAVVVQQCANECFTSELADSLALLGCGTQLVPGRFLAANNGGHNHHSARIGQWIEGGIWENAGDDTVHVSALVNTVLELRSPTELVLGSAGAINRYATQWSDGDLGVAVGDVLQFFDRKNGVTISEQRVESVVSVSRRGGTVVKLDGPVGKITPGKINDPKGLNASVTQVFNFNRTSNQFVFRSNTVRNGRRVGILYKGYRSWIENNTFIGLGGGALESWNAPYEGLCSRGVLFRNNTVTDVCQLDRGAAPLWTQSFSTATDGPPCFYDYLVSGNTFNTGPGPTVLLDDIVDAAFMDNDFTICANDPAPVNVSANSQSGYFFGSSNQVQQSTSQRLCQK